ncbi:MAG TPA: LuxR C-terminal-related transcriptional regulator [Ktedonobacterales bacterium]
MIADTSPLRSNLPAHVSSFIGRERELEQIALLLRQRRLVTLTGSGGVGKTRLALRAAEAALDSFADGVWLVELAPIARPELVAETIAKVVRASESSEQSPLETLGLTLSAKRSLLVIDNCEHLLGECVRVVAYLLARCPSVTVLATSREPLALGGEQALRVSPLSLPAPSEPLESQTADRLLDYDAIRLFTERACAAEPSFHLSSVTAPAVVEICRRLDGIPLALELAAMRVRGMGVAYLGARLDDRFRLLAGGSGAAEPRQQTLDATVAWSYDLLSERERLTLRRLGVFMGDFSPEAAEAVCAAPPAPATQTDGAQEPRETRESTATGSVFDILARLVDKSLAQFDQDTGLYRLLETIRLYCRERLALAGELQHVTRQHFVYYLQLAEDGVALLGGAGQQGWFARIEQEHDNYRAALGWAIQAGRADEAARLALSLWRFWRDKTYQREGLRWLEQIAALESQAPFPRELRPSMLDARGVLTNMARQFDRAKVFLEEALRLWTEEGDQAGMAQALIDLGWVCFQEVDLAQTKRYATASVPIAEQSGDRRLIASALLLDGLADVHTDVGALFGFDGFDASGERYSGQMREAVSTLERSLALWRELGDVSSQASTLSILGVAYQGIGDFERAKAALAEAARLHLGMGDAGNVNGALVGLMNLGARLADGPEMARDAARIFGALVALNRTIADQPSPWDSAEPSRMLRERLTGLLGPEDYAQAFAEGGRLTTAELLATVERITQPATSPRAPQAPHAPRKTPAVPPLQALPHASLTRRELEVLRLVAQGMTNAQVGRELVITPRTVNAHLTAIYGKLGVVSRSGAIRYAITNQLG